MQNYKKKIPEEYLTIEKNIMTYELHTWPFLKTAEYTFSISKKFVCCLTKGIGKFPQCTLENDLLPVYRVPLNKCTVEKDLSFQILP